MAREYFIRDRDTDRNGKPIVHAPDTSHYVPEHHLDLDFDKPITTRDLVEDEGGRIIATHPKKRKRHSGQGYRPEHERDDNYHDNLKRKARHILQEAITDALVGKETFEEALNHEQIAQEELDYVFDAKDEWVDWQNGERFDGAQDDDRDTTTPTNSFEYRAPKSKNAALKKLMRSQQLFFDAQSYRKPEGRGHVKATTGYTDKPVPQKTPKYTYKK